MKSIIDEALNRHDDQQKAQEVSKGVGIYKDSPDDEELRSIVETLKINVKIVGCTVFCNHSDIVWWQANSWITSTSAGC